MMWLYLPETYSPSAPVSAASNSESCSPSIVAERLAGASVTWRGKHRPPQAWSHLWKRGGFIRRLSGLTLPPSTAARGVAMFISSLAAIPVRTIPLPESAPGQTGNDSSPPKSFALPKSAGLIVSSAKTSRGTRTDSFTHWPRHWSAWATALRQEYSVRPELGTPCDASACSSWPNAKTASGGWERDRNGNVYPTLAGLAEQREGPSVAVTEGSRLSRSGARSDELLLTGQALMASERCDRTTWPGPAARDHKGTNSADHLLVSTGSLHLNQIPNFVEHVFLPQSSPDLPTLAGGSMSSTASPNTNQPSARRKLNPIFVEALMRWSTGLSGFERAETAWTRWLHAQLTFLSMLYSQEQGPAQPDLF